MAGINNIAASARRALRVALTAAIAIALGIAMAGSRAAAEPPHFLVAKPDLGDSLFEQSVVLILPPPSPQMVSGVIINKPTTISVKQVFPRAVDLSEACNTVYFGGPVGLDALLMVRRTTAPIESEVRVFGDLYLSVDPNKIVALLRDPSIDKTNVRVFEGYSVWTVPQLEREKTEDSWYEVPASAESVFTSDPKQLWKHLAARGRMQQVELPQQPYSPPRVFNSAFRLPPTL